MTRITKVLVAGGGIGGLCTAIGLLRKGIAVDLVEIKPQNTPLGVGIIQPANALRALDDLGVMDKCLAAGFQVDEWRCQLNSLAPTKWPVSERQMLAAPFQASKASIR